MSNPALTTDHPGPFFVLDLICLCVEVDSHTRLLVFGAFSTWTWGFKRDQPDAGWVRPPHGLDPDGFGGGLAPRRPGILPGHEAVLKLHVVPQLGVDLQHPVLHVLGL